MPKDHSKPQRSIRAEPYPTNIVQSSESTTPSPPTMLLPAMPLPPHMSSMMTRSFHAPEISAMDPSSPPPGTNANIMTGERASTAWTPQDDERLMHLRASNLNWMPIAMNFPGKTPNACRKRHERLMERKNAENWDGVRIELLARAYLDSREEMWKVIAEKIGEKWQTVEQKCMEKGLKTLQTAGRQRRNVGIPNAGGLGSSLVSPNMGATSSSQFVNMIPTTGPPAYQLETHSSPQSHCSEDQGTEDPSLCLTTDTSPNGQSRASGRDSQPPQPAQLVPNAAAAAAYPHHVRPSIVDSSNIYARYNNTYAAAAYTTGTPIANYTAYSPAQAYATGTPQQQQQMQQHPQHQDPQAAAAARQLPSFSTGFDNSAAAPSPLPPLPSLQLHSYMNKQADPISSSAY